MKFGLLFRPQDPPDAANIGQRWQEILAAGPSHELELEAIRRFGRDVIPAFKD